MKIGMLYKWRFAFIGLLFSTSVHAGASPLPGHELSLFWVLPFVGVLLSLALMPILFSSFWHHHYGKIVFLWTLAILMSILIFFGFDILLAEVSATFFHHYFPFITIITTLYIIAGGIHVNVRGPSKPLMNTGFLAIATMTASFIGTTGAAVLFIRPLLNLNKNRHYKRHTLIFYIFLVCNIGGCLTALGDPPLFLGYLNGIPFFWPMTHLFWPFLVITVPLLSVYFLIESWYFRREPLKVLPKPIAVKVEGFLHVGLLFCAISLILLSGSLKSVMSINFFHVLLEANNLARDLGLIFIACLSLYMQKKHPLEGVIFSWGPIVEVAKIFAAIFITASPVIAILHAGGEGELRGIIHMVNNNGIPDPKMYFWLTGFLSAFLDNAPTYLIFFHMAGGKASEFLSSLQSTLVAISAGSVFMGALTYIGNAPNFMVKAIAEANEIRMPSFFGYMAWSLIFLGPLFILLTWLIF